MSKKRYKCRMNGKTDLNRRDCDFKGHDLFLPKTKMNGKTDLNRRDCDLLDNREE